MKKTIRNITCTFVLGISLLLGFLTQAQAADFKMGVIDLRYIVTNSAESKALQAKLKKEFAPREQELIAREKSFKELIEKLQRNAAIMGVAEKAKLEKEASAKQKELQTLQLKFQEEGANRQREEMQKLLDKIQKSINQVAIKEKLDMVFVNDAVPYPGHQKDITQSVMQNLSGKS